MEPTVRQLEIFLAVARAGSFRRAADAIHLTQPAVSQHIGEMERGLGTRLLDRHGRRVTLTEAGRIVQEHAIRVLATLGSLREAVGELDGMGRGSLLIGAGTTPGIYLLPDVIGRFERTYPRVAVELRIANSRAIEEQIRANELDLGVVGGHGLRPGETCLAAGVLDRLVLIVPAGHPWAGRRSVAPAVLSRERLLIREEGSATRDVTERALQRAGVSLGRTMELGHTEAIKHAVMAGLGVAFVSIHAVRRQLETGDLRHVRLPGVEMTRHFHIIHNEARTLTARGRAFMAMVQEVGAATPAEPAAGGRRLRTRAWSGR
jgi:DNA-binding transcriptional LysR family regulator